MSARVRIPSDGRPRLTQLDQRVLERVPAVTPGIRARAIVEAINGRQPATDVDEVRGILRGFEHLGLVRQTTGWWTKT